MNTTLSPGWDQIEPWRRAQRQTLLRQRQALDPVQRQIWDTAIGRRLRDQLPEPAGLIVGAWYR